MGMFFVGVVLVCDEGDLCMFWLVVEYFVVFYFQIELGVVVVLGVDVVEIEVGLLCWQCGVVQIVYQFEGVGVVV